MVILVIKLLDRKKANINHLICRLDHNVKELGILNYIYTTIMLGES
jgi:hypothetical protein